VFDQNTDIGGMEIEKQVLIPAANCLWSKSTPKLTVAILLHLVAAAADPRPNGDCHLRPSASVLLVHTFQCFNHDTRTSPSRVEQSKGSVLRIDEKYGQTVGYGYS